MQAEDDLLKLCRICHAKPFKYRCPRCDFRSCSLECVKKHKKWASCSGVRNPATYIKRGDLLTPSGIDRDFNYLASIERKFEEGDKLADKIGVDIYGNMYPDEPKRQYKKRIALTRALKQSGIDVERAPPGMSRAKKNKTLYHTEKKYLEWTIEIVDLHGRIRYGNVLETASLMSVAMRILPGSMFEDAEHQPHFYLRMVRTSCQEVCLIEIDARITVQLLLKGRRIIEYPTFYVLPNGPDDLPEALISESTYKQRFSTPNPKMQIPIKLEPPAEVAFENTDGLPFEDQVVTKAEQHSPESVEVQQLTISADLAVAAAAAMG